MRSAKGEEADLRERLEIQYCIRGGEAGRRGWVKGEQAGGHSRRQSLPLLLNALLLVATSIHVKVEIIPVFPGREGDGLAEGEADGVDDPLTPRLTGAHADGGGAAGGPEQVGRRGEVMELSVVQDPLPDGMSELLWDL